MSGDSLVFFLEYSHYLQPLLVQSISTRHPRRNSSHSSTLLYKSDGGIFLDPLLIKTPNTIKRINSAEKRLSLVSVQTSLPFNFATILLCKTFATPPNWRIHL
jgi:hypothetical protein